MNPDRWLFEAINGLAGRVAPLDGLMRLLVNDYFVPTTLCLLLLLLWFEGEGTEERRENQRTVIGVLLAYLVANIAVKAFNLVYFRPRPFSVEEVTILFYHPSDSSFPSNPAAATFAIAAATWIHHRRLGMVMTILVALFGLARIYCGVHYPLDIVVGALIGVLAAYLVARGHRFLRLIYDFPIKLARRLYLA